MAPDSKSSQIKLRWRRTKIVATLGPACSSRTRIKRLLRAGVDVLRLNMSHGDRAEHRMLYDHVRSCAEELGQRVAVLVDLAGPKLRAGRFEAGAVTLRAGAQVTLTTRAVKGTEDRIPVNYSKLPEDVHSGDRVLLDDGKLELKVRRVKGTEVQCRVTYGGELRDRKGINLPDSRVSAPSLTPKDRKDARFALGLGADYLALSFVRSADDVRALKRLVTRNGGDTPVIAKIEKPEAVEDIDAIIEACDGIMVARGDLGVELPPERVPLVQRHLIRIARQRDKPVIVATQMLESMINHSRPTRAEVGDVANAALACADAVMLSGETAVGRHPLKAVRIMDRIVREMETYQWEQGTFGESPQHDLQASVIPIRDAVARATSGLARDLRLQGIVIPTRTGTTARIIAAERPLAPLVAVCTDPVICRRLALVWGVIPNHLPAKAIGDSKELCREVAKRNRLTHTGRTFLLVAGFHEDPKLSEPQATVFQI